MEDPKEYDPEKDEELQRLILTTVSDIDMDRLKLWSKEVQRQGIIEMMRADEADGLYEVSAQGIVAEILPRSSEEDCSG